jgi:hypothetical protein
MASRSVRSKSKFSFRAVILVHDHFPFRVGHFDVHSETRSGVSDQTSGGSDDLYSKLQNFSRIRNLTLAWYFPVIIVSFGISSMKHRVSLPFKSKKSGSKFARHVPTKICRRIFIFFKFSPIFGGGAHQGALYFQGH